jgi:hypothetical protein
VVPRLKDISCPRFLLPLDVGADVIHPSDRLDSLTPAELRAFSSGPLRVLQLSDFVALRNRSERGLDQVAAAMPFDLSAHPIARTYNGARVLTRVAEDVANFAEQQNESQEAELLEYLEPDVQVYVREGAASPGFAAARAQLAKLADQLTALLQSDMQKMVQLIGDVLRAVNSAVPSAAEMAASPAGSPQTTRQPSTTLSPSAAAALSTAFEAAVDAVSSSTTGGVAAATQQVAQAAAAAVSSPGGAVAGGPAAPTEDGIGRSRLSYALARYGGLEHTLTFDFLVGLLLSPTPQFELQQLNPLLSASVSQAVLRALVQVLFIGNRVGHVRRCRTQLAELQEANAALLGHFADPNRSKDASSSSSAVASVSSWTPFVRDVVLKAEKLAALLVARRYFVEVIVNKDIPDAKPTLQFDPRFLVFEFTYNLLLRKSQVELVTSIVHSGSGSDRKSVAYQMLMGAGKVSRKNNKLTHSGRQKRRTLRYLFCS